MSQLQKYDKGPLLVCPVCIDIPKARVDQCKNGHIICEGCAKNLLICPVCRDPYEKERIRCLAAEHMIEEMEISCKHKDAGCTAKIIKRDLAAHLKVCKFRPIKNICKQLGYATCNFESPKPTQLFQHLVKEHKVGNAKARAVTIPLSIFLDPLKKAKGADGILKFGVEIDLNCMVLQLVRVCAVKDEFSVCFVHFGEGAGDGDPCPYLATFQLTAPPKVDHVTWATLPVPVRELEEEPLSFPLKISGRYILKHMDLEGAKAEVKFTQLNIR